LPYNNIIQIGGKATMNTSSSNRRQIEHGEAAPRPNGARKRRSHEAYYWSGGRTESAIFDARNRMVKILPRLRRFARALTGNWELSEDLIQETYVRALAHLDQWQPGTRLDSWMFRIAQNLWIDQMRAEKTRGEAVDIEIISEMLSCDGLVIAENRIVLQELRKDIARLSLDQRNVIKLVCGYGMSYKETGEILKLPAGTVMSRLARARDALQKYV
jgi:RNA polymerase sigma-70 factor (ECF subfamily)